jgi:Holliday junction resolvasome RuvABC endonuclease subunit
MEDSFNRFNNATQQLYRVHGISNLCFTNTEQLYIKPKTLKKSICNNGNATKQEMIDAIRHLYPDVKIHTDDEADALGLIHYYKKFIERVN